MIGVARAHSALMKAVRSASISDCFASSSSESVIAAEAAIVRMPVEPGLRDGDRGFGAAMQVRRAGLRRQARRGRRGNHASIRQDERRENRRRRSASRRSPLRARRHEPAPPARTPTYRDEQHQRRIDLVVASDGCGVVHLNRSA